MHELSIAISMIDQITEESANRGGLDVEAVHLRLGVFSGVDKDALLFSWELACEGSCLEGTRLVIETILGLGTQLQSDVLVNYDNAGQA